MKPKQILLGIAFVAVMAAPACAQVTISLDEYNALLRKADSFDALNKRVEQDSIEYKKLQDIYTKDTASLQAKMRKLSNVNNENKKLKDSLKVVNKKFIAADKKAKDYDRVSKDLKSTNDSLKSLNKSIKNIQNDNKKLESRVNKLAGLESKNDSLRGTIEKLSNENKSIRGDVDVLRSPTRALRNYYDSQKPSEAVARTFNLQTLQRDSTLFAREGETIPLALKQLLDYHHAAAHLQRRYAKPQYVPEWAEELNKKIDRYYYICDCVSTIAAEIEMYLKSKEADKAKGNESLETVYRKYVRELAYKILQEDILGTYSLEDLSDYPYANNVFDKIMLQVQRDITDVQAFEKLKKEIEP